MPTVKIVAPPQIELASHIWHQPYMITMWHVGTSYFDGYNLY